MRERGQAQKGKTAAMREAASVVSSSLIVVSKMDVWVQRGAKVKQGPTVRTCSLIHNASFFDWSTA